MAKAKKAATGQKKPRGRPAKNQEAGAAAEPKTKATAHRYNSPVDEESKALFLQTLPKIADLRAKLNTANANLRNAYKTAKKDGFLKGDFDVAFQIQQAEGEKAKKAAIARDLTIAKWLGADLGAQLDLFVQDERVPAVDRAYEEGVAASMKGESAKPGYDPSTEQYRSFMKGYHDDQENRINKGIKKLDPAIAEDEARKAAEAKAIQDQKDADAATFADGAGDIEETTVTEPDPPTSGVAVTRSQFRAQQQQAQAQQDKPAPMFTRRS